MDLPLSTMERIDQLKAKTARLTGKRPSLRNIILAALDAHLTRELGEVER